MEAELNLDKKISSKILAYDFLYSADVFGSEYYKIRTKWLRLFLYLFISAFVDNYIFPITRATQPVANNYTCATV